MESKIRQFTSHPFTSCVTLDNLLILFENLHLLNGPTEVPSLSTPVFFQQLCFLDLKAVGCQLEPSS